MVRLSRYLSRLFWSEAMGLFAVAAFLLFLIQCLRLFDLVSDKGQSLLTLVGQALFSMPGLGVVFLYVCLGIGLGRALRGLQASSELGIIHSNGLVGALLRAMATYTVVGALLVMFLAHVADPLGIRANNDWSTSIAADLVSRSMIPHRFTSLGGGVSIVIGGRDSRGNISDFFADDPRDPDSHRTYFARSAIIAHDEQGYVLRMRDGAVQYLTPDQRFSQVAFQQYDLPMDRLAGTTSQVDQLSRTPSYDLIADGLASGHWDPAAVNVLMKRTSEGLRVLAFCAMVAALAMFPTGRRGGQLPIEIVVLGAAFLERVLTAYIVGPGLLSVASGSVIILVVAAGILLVRLKVFRPVRRPRSLAA